MEMTFIRVFCMVLVLNIAFLQNCQGQIIKDDDLVNPPQVSKDCHHGINVRGFCVCYPGFEGTNCDKYSPTNPCYVNPCNNDGTCIPQERGDSFQCFCAADFTGVRCEKSINVNVNNDPLTGGDSAVSRNVTVQNSSSTENHLISNQTNTVNLTHINNTQNENLEFNATLLFNNETGIFDNDTLDNSTQNINETDWYDNQSDNSTFENGTINNFQVIQGLNDSLPCNSTTCRAGQCVSTDNNTRICVCLEGWEGPTCEEIAEENPCYNNTCMNGASCLPNFNLTDYECICANGFTGLNCELEGNQTDVDIDLCEQHFCMNNGTRSSNSSGCFCVCPERFEGRNCEKKIPTPCDPSPCLNGICSEINNGTSYSCRCFSGFEGQNCDWMSGIRVCEETPCQNGGSCRRSGLTSYTCTCQIGYAGRNCDVYVGTACDRNPCEQGTCTPTGINEYSCRCELGYQGRNCDKRVEDICSLRPCQNGGTCRRTNETNSYQCLCYWGYSGRNCEEHVGTACDSHPCQYGTCSLNTNTDYTCACFPGFTGRYCENRLTACLQMPCSNGQCTDVNEGRDYRCSCYAGFGGRNCDRYIGLPCSNNKCYNGGICRNVNHYRDFQCSCKRGFYGRRCQYSVHSITEAPTTIPVTEESTPSTTEAPTTIPAADQNSIGRCGGTFNASRGIITSPSYPENYPANQHCVYKIHVQRNQKIELKFDTFNLESGVIRCFDVVKIYDGGHNRYHLKGMGCGKRSGLVYTSKTNLIYVVFSSDRTIQKQGFYATYVAAEDESPCRNDPCGRNGRCYPTSHKNYRCLCKRGYAGERCQARLIMKSFRNDDGIVASPNFYRAYATGLRVVYLIRVSIYKRVQLTFKQFHLADRDENKKCTEVLKIYDGMMSHRRSRYAGKLVFNGCGTKSPDSFTSSRNMLTIYYATDEAHFEHGFVAKYRTIRR